MGDLIEFPSRQVANDQLDDLAEIAGYLAIRAQQLPADSPDRRRIERALQQATDQGVIAR